MRYGVNYTAHRRPSPFRYALYVFGLVLVLGIISVSVLYAMYRQNLRPVSNDQITQLVTIQAGSTAEDIAMQFQKQGLIRSAWAFQAYVTIKRARGELQAGSYAFEPSQSTPQIVSQLTHGKIATDLITILPGQRLDQIRAALIQYGFKEQEVAAALDPAQYAGHPALADKPPGASLEGFLYPDSFQKTGSTDPKAIITASLDEMQQHLTPDLKSAFATQGINTYQAITLASIVGQEVPSQDERAQVAQVFLKRLRIDMPLGADPTAYYGAILAGQPPSTGYDSPYNTHLHKGLPPSPISNVNASALEAVAHPSNTDWLYFVAGDDGVTHFSRTLQEHEALTRQYCHKLCPQ